MGIIKPGKHSEKSVVKPRSETATPNIDCGPGPKQYEASGCAKLPGGILSRLAAGRNLAKEVLLRDHRLMNYRTLANWPPVWMRRGRENGATADVPLRGEIGTLKEAFVSTVAQPPRIYLIVVHEGLEYIGSLLFNDAVFCLQIYRFLKGHRGETIAEIGRLKVSQRN